MEERLLEIAREEAADGEIEMDTPLDTLGFDSLGILALIQSFEAETNRLFRMDKLKDAATLGDLICIALNP